MAQKCQHTEVIDNLFVLNSGKKTNCVIQQMLHISLGVEVISPQWFALQHLTNTAVCTFYIGLIKAIIRLFIVSLIFIADWRDISLLEGRYFDESIFSREEGSVYRVADKAS